MAADLDLAEWKRAAAAAAENPVGSDYRVVRATPEDVLALVAEVERQDAELRAAREVVEATRPYVIYTPPCDCPNDAHPLASALAAYDRVAGGVGGRG